MITIHTPLESREYGVYDNAGTWTQADASHLAEALAVMDAIPTVAGSFDGTVYEDTDELYAVDTDTDTDVVAKPYETGTLTATITTDSDAAVEDTSDLTITVTNQFDPDIEDYSDMLDKIYFQDRIT